MKAILKPEFALIGEIAGKPVGFALAIPDINLALKPAQGNLFPFGLLKILYHQRKIKSLRVMALGVIAYSQLRQFWAGMRKRSATEGSAAGTPSSTRRESIPYAPAIAAGVWLSLVPKA